MAHKKKGCFFIILSAVIFGCMPLMADRIYEGGGNALSLVFYRSFLALPALFFLSKREESENRKERFDWGVFKKVVILVVFGLGITPVFLFLSYQYLASGIATTLHFIYPVFVLAGCVIFGHKAVTRSKLLCVACCTVGIFCLCDMSGGGSALGIFLALLSGVTYAFYIVYLDQSGLKHLPHFKLGFWCAAAVSVLMLPITAVTGTLTLHMTPEAWILSLLFSNLVTVGAVVLFQRGVEQTGAQAASILSTAEPLTSIVMGILFLREKVHVRTLLGVLFILFSVVVLTLSDDEKGKTAAKAGGKPGGRPELS